MALSPKTWLSISQSISPLEEVLGILISPRKKKVESVTDKLEWIMIM